MRTFNELFRLSQHTVQHYRTDFVHDFKTIKHYPGKPYVHLTRKCGTTLVMLHSTQEILDAVYQDNHQYLIEKYIAWPMIVLNHYIVKEPNVELIHYFDGKKLSRISQEKAIQIIYEWESKIRREIESITSPILNQ